MSLISLYFIQWSKGKLKESYLVDGIAVYVKRLGPYAKVQMIEVPDEKAPQNLRPAEEQQVRVMEGEQLAFVIGGSLELSSELLRRADTRLSFGRMTLPHKLL
ncbi:hypothetical protein GC098_25065 [Paenibacillus sp. LMG 31458]|uniref:Uncharacterized protein n=1 Tax=Paenibacillus phytorum TaxID=2654977 RepID=A0ABX1Y195_9BACL|nr:hypothetical protein [Paenibacillus phytorum]